MKTYNPFEEMSRLFAEMDRRLDELRSSGWGGEATWEEFEVLPAADDSSGDRWTLAPLRRFAGFGGAVRLDRDREAGAYVAIVDLPGFETEEIDLRLENGVLAINAVHEVEEAEYTGSRRFDERVSIPGSVDEDAVTASYRNGVLEVRLPTTDDEPVRRIEVEE